MKTDDHDDRKNRFLNIFYFISIRQKYRYLTYINQDKIKWASQN